MSLLFLSSATNAQFGTQDESYQLFGAGCRGPGGVAELRNEGLPKPGTKFSLVSTYGRASTHVVLLTGRSGTAWGPHRLPLELGFLGARGCWLYASPDVALGAMSDAAGRASFSLTVPAGLRLRLTWFNQALWWDPRANAVGWLTSNGGNGAIGYPGGGTKLSTISQFGITWTFDRKYEAGQFVTGDWWVIGPVKVVDINPPSIKVPGRRSYADKIKNRKPGSSYINGSMLNPLGGTLSVGYDSATDYTGYSHSKNVAYGVSRSKPLFLEPGTSLISSISRSDPQARPQLETQAVLTVLGRAPPPGSFRPPYAGPDKRVKYNESQLRYSLLQSLKPVAHTPELATVERWFERPWVDHQGSWSGGRSHASGNMPEYGRDSSSRVSVAACMLHLNFTQAQKRKLLIAFVQLGIDTYGVVQNGGEKNWPGNGGTGHGRKWPILFAGLMLNDSDMLAIGSRKGVYFGEDFQTFFVAETSPGVYNRGYGGYTKAHVGMPEWGFEHQTKPQKDDVRWGGSTTLAYRHCCTANAWGFVLAARMMNAQKLWKHDALFEYHDRYMAKARQLYGQFDRKRAWHEFNAAMYDTYRERF